MVIDEKILITKISQSMVSNKNNYSTGQWQGKLPQNTRGSSTGWHQRVDQLRFEMSGSEKSDHHFIHILAVKLCTDSSWSVSVEVAGSQTAAVIKLWEDQSQTASFQSSFLRKWMQYRCFSRAWKLLLVEKSTCRDLHQWDSHSYDGSTVPGTVQITSLLMLACA